MTFKNYLNENAKDLGSYALRVKEGLTYLYINDTEFKTALENYDTEGMEEKILFVFGIKEDLGLNVFDAVYAKKGFGPIAYKVAMTLYKEMSPVQDSRLTPSAERVWKEFYNGKGTKDVNINTFGSSEDLMWKRSIYSLKKKISLNKHKRTHDNFVGKDPYDEIISQLDEVADGLLTSEMRAIY